MSMASPGDGVSVPPEREILRTPIPPKDFTPDGWKPTWQELAPSEADKQDALTRNGPVRVSVWDAQLTTIAAAKAFRSRSTIALSAQVSGVVAAGARDVVYEPLPPSDAAKAGADGHCGIEGLERPPNEPRPSWKERLQRVADCFRVVPDV
jgi:hypothetical protein